MADATRSRRPNQTRSRAVAKTVCYRCFMFLITAAVTFLVTGAASEALAVGVATNALKTVTYYVYERTWDRISWGIR